MKVRAKTVLAVLTILGSGGGAIAQDGAGGDAAAGEQVFKKCMTCHRVGAGAKNGVGPQQNGVIGRTAGTVPGYAYSPINKAAGEAGLTWTEANVFAYLSDPNAFLKKFLTEKGKDSGGTTKMAFKLTSEKERRDVIAYLKTQQEAK
jgi:cytochrome c